MKILIIIGDTNSGKSTLIRNLTGIGNGAKTLHLKFVNGIRAVFVRNAAIQEILMEIAKLIEELTKESKKAEYAILALRTKTKMTKGVTYPSGEEYITEIIRNNFVIDKIIKLSDFEFTDKNLEDFSETVLAKPYNLRAEKVRELINLI